METNGLRMALNSDDAPRMRRGRLRGPVRAALWALGCVVFAFWAPASAEPKPRTTLVLYPYHGIGGVDVSALGDGRWVVLVRAGDAYGDPFGTEHDELVGAGRHQSGGVARLHPRPIGGDVDVAVDPAAEQGPRLLR